MDKAGSQGISAQFLLRLLIVIYFVALSLGLTQGADIRAISDSLLPSNLSHYATRGLTLTLAGMILFDVQRQIAALILSVFVFWSSYLSIILGGSVGMFWANFALIGALLYIGGVGKTEYVLPDAYDHDDTPRETVAEHKVTSRQLPGGDSPYREDLEVVRNL